MSSDPITSSSDANDSLTQSASSEFTVKGRYNPNAASAGRVFQPVASERTAAVAALANASAVVVARVETPAEIFAAATSKITVTIDGLQHPLSALQSAKKGKDGPLSTIDFDLKHVRLPLPLLPTAYCLFVSSHLILPLLPPPSLPTLQSYLSEDDFKIVFSMSFDDFDKLPAWKQKTLREKVKLF